MRKPNEIKIDTVERLLQEVINRTKLDGENTSLYKDAIHARSLSSGHNPSRTWVKTLQGSMGG
ncbi:MULTISPECIES: RNA ligase family protein [Bacillus]|uniref:RNA ligase family protein n=1 Tax=Bacillus TaxID=1386 RepID=UPI0020D217CC|nr:RNA ligase family protein [Bacillus cereus]MEB9440738.1 RNA ligase family protein [Bacillus cereus]